MWKFGNHTLDPARSELTGPSGLIPIERFPLDVLIYLAENNERVISRDELIEQVWKGRVVSDAAVSTAIKQARKAVSDTASERQVIRTIHRRGYRFVATLTREPEPHSPPFSFVQEGQSANNSSTLERHGVGKPSIAVLRFSHLGNGEHTELLCSALPAELITGLSRLRWLRVIARGSSFQFSSDAFDPKSVADRLGTRYLLTGMLESVGNMITVTLDLLSAVSGELIWSNRMTSSIGEIQHLRPEIVATVSSELERAIPSFEAEQLKDSEHLEFDAWSHFHRGLAKIFKFNSVDNHAAGECFQAALSLEHEFARAHAGLSFSHFQNGFLQYSSDRSEHVRLALDSADTAVSLDPSDAFVNFNMGRAFWLDGDIAAAQSWLERALEFNPSYAHCHYNQGLLHAFDGKPELANESSELAQTLSPLDPLSYAFVGVQAWSSMMEGDFESATKLADKANRQPGAHVLIKFMAALAHELHGNRHTAIQWRDSAIISRPDITITTFLNAFPFTDSDFRNTISNSLRRLDVHG